MPCSPAVDAGTNSGSPLLDVLNNAVFNNIKDMGAYESQALCITNTNEPTGNAKLSVFPNPFSDKLSIYAENSNQSMEITDVFGHLLLTTVTVPPTIDLSHFASGVYFIRIGQETKKIVKMK
jgi:hypothetical protein